MRRKWIRFIIVCFCFVILNSSYVKADKWTEDTQNNKETAEKLWCYAIQNGATELWAAAAVGNSISEHGLCTEYGSNPDYFGPFQEDISSLGDYESWCDNNGRPKTGDITSFYDYLYIYRNGIPESLVGLSSEELKKDTTYIVDTDSAAAYWAGAMEGCVGSSGDPSRDGSFTFKSGGMWNNKSQKLQILKERQENTAIVYKIFSGKDISVNSSGEVEGSDAEEVGALLEESLEGMIAKSKLAEEQSKIDLKSREDLGISDQYSLALISQGIDINKEANALDIARRLIMFIGLSLLSYTVLIFISMIFDKVNTFLDFSMVGLITFGKVNYNPNEDVGGSTKYISTKKLIICTIIMFLIGLLIISGSIFTKMSQFAYWFSQKFLY